MPVFKVTVKQMKWTNGLRIEKGMSVEVPSTSMTNPLLSNGGREVADAFMRIYGVDLKKLGALSSSYLDVQRIG